MRGVGSRTTPATASTTTSVRQLAHHVLGGPIDAGRAAYQIAMTVCERCNHASRDGAGRAHPVAASCAEAAACDAQVLPMTHGGQPVQAAAEVAGGKAEVAGGETEVAGGETEVAGGETAVAGGTVRAVATHVGQPVRAATQTIPPRIRRAVWRRDHGRCRAPGCRAARFLEVHHIVPRAVGGTHDPGNLMLLCSAHHARVHDGSFVVAGRAPEELAFTWRDEVSAGARLASAESAHSAAGATDAAAAVPGEKSSPYAGSVGRHESADPGATASEQGGAPYQGDPSERGAIDPSERGAIDPSERGAIDPSEGGQLAADAIGALRRLGVEAGHARAAVVDALGEHPRDIEPLLRRALALLYERVYAARFVGAGPGIAAVR